MEQVVLRRSVDGVSLACGMRNLLFFGGVERTDLLLNEEKIVADI